jgi:hypothetical protein
MRPFNDPSSLTPDQRRAAVANILAAGILRLQTRDALSDEAANSPTAKKLSKPRSSCLEVSEETVLSVHNG